MLQSLAEIFENSYRLPSYQRVAGVEARLDGMSFTFHLLDLPKVRVFVENILQAPFEFQSKDYGSRWYQNFSLGSAGAVLHWQHRQGYPLGLCELKGEFFSYLDSYRQKRLVDFVASINAKPSILALDLDDYSRRFSPLWFLGQWERGLCRGFKTWDYIKSYKPANNLLAYGESIGFGRRGNLGGQKRFICYDKYVESGALNCYRYELTLYKHKAQKALDLLAEAPIEQWHFLIANLVQGEAKFISFKPGDISINLGSKRPKNCLYAKHRWLQRQCSLVYAVLAQVYRENGDVNLGEILEDIGKNSPKYQSLLDTFRNFYSLNSLIQE